MVGSSPKFYLFILKLLYLARLVLAFLHSFFYSVEVEGDSNNLMNENSMDINLLKSDEVEEKPEPYLKFKFPTFQEFSETQNGRGNNEFLFGETSIAALIVDVKTFPDKEITVSCNRNGDLEEISFDSESGNDEPFDIEESEFVKIVEQNVKSPSESLIFNENPSACRGYDTDHFDNSFLSETNFGDDIEINSHDATTVASLFLSEQDFDEHSDAEQDDEGNAYMSEWDDDDSDSLWEHQELVEQLKMELKKVRASGLPTILEESEASPKVLMDNLKPWKMENFQHQDCIGELRKFYKSYRERMRKFDIISFQKMYTMGCLQMKDPLQSVTNSKTKTSSSLFKYLLSKNKIHSSDPMKKFVKELQDDMETVYVAHMCLSWEFLQWQYEKAFDLWDVDPDGILRYNEVAGEFQQFQVLMQRFIEEEPFQGPRIQHYINTRHAHRNILQVPVIRQDNPKGKKKGMIYDQGEYTINSEKLLEILEESIRMFWQFLRADKDSAITTSGNQRNLPETGSSQDLKLLLEAKKIVEKKNRKLKDVMRTKNCILKKCRRRGMEGDDQVFCFFSQVDMRLVWRTLNMSKITRDQLVWCHEKMNKMSFVDRRLFVEPAFLLFPC